MLCTVTATLPDGKRSTLEAEARSVNYATIEYNYRAVNNSQRWVVPDRQTVFEVSANGKVYRTTWDRVSIWAARKAEVSIRRS